MLIIRHVEGNDGYYHAFRLRDEQSVGHGFQSHSVENPTVTFLAGISETFSGAAALYAVEIV